MNKLIILLLIVICFTSCVSVKEYEKELINDPEMKLGARTSERHEVNFQVYREGRS
jgi:hypothetical protein